MEDTLKIINDKRAFLAERARKNYNIRKAEGRQPIKAIPIEQQKKRGRKPKEAPNTTPKPRGRPPAVINDLSQVKEYLKPLLKKRDTTTQ